MKHLEKGNLNVVYMAGLYIIWDTVCVKFIFACAIMYLGKEMPLARQTVRSDNGISDNTCIIYHIIFSYSQGYVGCARTIVFDGDIVSQRIQICVTS